MEKSESSPQDKKTVTFEVTQDYSAGGSTGAIPYTGLEHVSPRNVSESEAASGEFPQSEATTVLTDTSDEGFWTKLEDMQQNYLHRLQELLPVIRRLQARQSEDKRKLFMPYLNDALNILKLSRSFPVPPRVTLTVLHRVERFIIQVIEIHSKYVIEVTRRNGIGVQPLE